MDRIVALGVNHKYASVALRERLAFGGERIPGLLVEMMSGRARLSEVVLLSTCNRTEVYLCAPDLPAAELALRRFLADQAGLDPEAMERILYCYYDEQAAKHLITVACGLDSLILGENEIIGQVRRAADLAHTAGTAGPVLAALFRHAVQAGKRVRAGTEIGKAALSVATVVVELAEEKFGSLADRTALLIGAGKISSMTAQALMRAGLHFILVANRTYERACRLAMRLEGRAVRFDVLAPALVEADIVICSTGAPHVVLHLEEVERAMLARPGRPLLVADLAVPRDVDPQIGNLPQVCLTGIDDLERLVRLHHPLTVKARREAEAIVAETAAEFASWQQARRSAPLIQELCGQAEAICSAQLEKTFHKLGDTLDSEQIQAIEVMAQAIAGQMLHAPITYLRREPDKAGLVRALYGLDDGEDRPEP